MKQQDLREAMIVVPYTDRHGKEVPGEKHNWFKATLLHLFNGYTQQEGHGAFLDKKRNVLNEDVLIVHVAFPDNAENIWRLRQAVLAFGHDANQDSVYIRWPDGNVDLLPIHHDEERHHESAGKVETAA